MVPHHNLELPPECDGNNYRPEKYFRLLRDGSMTYTGWGIVANRQMSSNVMHYGIKPNQKWIDRAYIFLVDEVKNRIKQNTMGCRMKYIEKLILKFNKIDFINFEKDEYEI